MTTPLDALATALTGTAAYQTAAEAAPEAVVWCDATGDFAPILPTLRTRLPQVLMLGDYDPAARAGPALWLRAAAARQVPSAVWPTSEPPILYLPGVAREVLRGAEDCPPEIAPLVWFAISGAFFGQPKQGRDWTMRGFLAAQGSPVGLNIPEDKTTREALARAATRLFAEPLAALAGKQWDAAALDGLLVEDPVVSMLAWIDGTLTKEADPARFEAFSALAAKQFGLDPRKKQRQDAAARLARREKAWGKVWERFEQTGGGYEGVVKSLGFEEPPQADLLDIPVAYPKANAQREDSLRSALLALRDQPAEKASQTVRELEATHAWRRMTVWAKRGEARLAQALEHLAVVAGAVPLPTHDADAMATAYGQIGWQIDAAAVASLDVARNGDDRAAVVAALRAIYLPWLDAGATALQALVGAGKVKLATAAHVPVPPTGAVLLFVDGLRMDLGQRLADLLRLRGATVTVGQRWSGFPTVTATCKSLASPAAHLLAAGSPDAMLPAYEGKAAQKPTLVKAIEAAGWSCGTPLLPDKPVWQEAGQFDQEGHALGAKLAERLKDGLDGVAAEVMKLAQQGRRVRVVTDHGWLLMPEGLPHASLTSALVQPSGRGNRVAMLKEGAPTTFLRVPWSWNSAVQYATPPGARAFYAGTEYAHGGISPQECVLPVLDVTAEGVSKPLAISAQWRNLMVRVKVDGGAGLIADVRLGSDSSGQSALIKSPKALDDAGQVNLGVDSAYEGREVCIVVWRPENPQEVSAKLVTKVGG